MRGLKSLAQQRTSSFKVHKPDRPAGRDLTTGVGSHVHNSWLAEDLPESVLVREQSPARLQNVEPQLLAAQQMDVHLVSWRETQQGCKNCCTQLCYLNTE